MQTVTQGSYTLTYPDYFIPIFNPAVFVLNGISSSATIEIISGGTSYIDMRYPMNEAIEWDIAPYLHALFPDFRDTKDRMKDVTVKIHTEGSLGSIPIIAKNFCALRAYSSPLMPLGTPLTQRVYTNYPQQKITLLMSDDDTAAVAPCVGWNQLATTTNTEEFRSSSAYRAYFGVQCGRINASHKYIGIVTLTAKNNGANISEMVNLFLGQSLGAFEQNVGYANTNTETAVFFTPQNDNLVYFIYATRYGTSTTSGDSWGLSLAVHDLTIMFGAGNEPKTFAEFKARTPDGLDNAYNEGEVVDFNGSSLGSWSGYKDLQCSEVFADGVADIKVLHLGGLVVHKFKQDDCTCGAMFKWLDAQGFYRYYMMQEGETTTTTKDAGENLVTNYEASQPFGMDVARYVGQISIPQGVETTQTRKYCATFSDADDRALLDTIFTAPLVWLIDGNEEIPVTIKRGGRATAKGLQDYEIEVNIPAPPKMML